MSALSAASPEDWTSLRDRTSFVVTFTINGSRLFCFVVLYFPSKFPSPSPTFPFEAGLDIRKMWSFNPPAFLTPVPPWRFLGFVFCDLSRPPMYSFEIARTSGNLFYIMTLSLIHI